LKSDSCSYCPHKIFPPVHHYLYQQRLTMIDSDIYKRWPKVTATLPDPPAPFYPEEKGDWDALWSRPVVDETAWISPGAVVMGAYA